MWWVGKEEDDEEEEGERLKSERGRQMIKRKRKERRVGRKEGREVVDQDRRLEGGGRGSCLCFMW